MRRIRFAPVVRQRGWTVFEYALSLALVAGVSAATGSVFAHHVHAPLNHVAVEVGAALGSSLAFSCR